MDSFEERLEIYKKSKTPRAVILEKIEQDFGIEYKKIALEILNSEEKRTHKKSDAKIITYILMIAMIVFIIFSIIIFTTPFFDLSEFNSSKCSKIQKISIEGTSSFKQKIFDALSLVENKNCAYLDFISQNYSPIYSKSTTPIASIYSPLKHNLAQDYAGSNYFIANAIIHQACHGFQSKQMVPQNEHDCALTQYNFLLNVGAPIEDIKKITDLNSSPEYSFNENNIDVFNEWQSK